MTGSLGRPSVALSPGEQVPAARVAEVEHALGTIAAWWGWQFVGATTFGDADLTIAYGHDDAPAGQVAIPVRSTTGPARSPAELEWLDIPARVLPGSIQALPCITGVDLGEPDPLGEVFEWLSARHETTVQTRDSAGRISAGDSLQSHLDIDPVIPWASLWGWWLADRVRAVHGRWPNRPMSPNSHHTHLLGATHDLDFLPRSRFQSADRLARNAAIAVAVHRDPALSGQIVRSSLGFFAGDDPLDTLGAMVNLESELGVRSTICVIPRSAHPRDAGYELSNEHVVEVLHQLQAEGLEIAVHGSYTSLDSRDGLRDEYELLRQVGFDPTGGRQHWLRYDDDRLSTSLDHAGASWDSTRGWSEQPGFRNGAASPFMPWNWTTAAPADHLEIPLIAMDTATAVAARASGRHPTQLLDDVIGWSHQVGWGGAAILWHDPTLLGAWLPWDTVSAFQRVWTTESGLVPAGEIAAACGDRYRWGLS